MSRASRAFLTVYVAILLSRFGQRLVPPLMVGSNVALLRATSDSVVVVTAEGLLYQWDISKMTAVHAALSLAPIMSQPINGNVVDALVTASGVVVVSVTSAQLRQGETRAPHPRPSCAVSPC